MIIPRVDEHYSKIISAISGGHACLHFSQLGEDCVIWHLYKTVKKGFYVDIGCHHPFRYSNTALLSLFNGWRGINVDADAEAIDLFRRHRPDDINIHCAVGNQTGKAEMFLFKNAGAVNTLDPTWAEHQTKVYGVPEKRIIDIVPLSEILDRYMPADTAIDLLNIDVEGFDLRVLQSNDWRRYRPKMICVETQDLNINRPDENETFRYMQDIGYQLRSHVWATSVYVPAPDAPLAGRSAMAASGSDCFRFARENSDPRAALFYYSAAEAAGVDDPDLLRERDALLRRLGQVELRYLNARCASWKDEAVLAETASELEGIRYAPPQFSDATHGADAAKLMRVGAHQSALKICKFLVQAAREVPYACFMAGSCVLQTDGGDAEALMWFNMAERLGSNARYWINRNRASLLRRAGLPLLALNQMEQSVCDSLADEAALASYYDIIEQLLAGSTDRSAFLQALRTFNDAKDAYWKRRLAEANGTEMP